MLTAVSQSLSSYPHLSASTVFSTPREVVVTMEEREAFAPFVFLISYSAVVQYTSESDFKIVSLNLLQEVRGADYRLTYKATPLDHISDPIKRAGLEAIIREDIDTEEGRSAIYEVICADMREHDEMAREYVAELRDEYQSEMADDIDF